MRVSVIIPTYRRPEFLRKALAGLAGQSRKADQIVVGAREDDVETVNVLAGCNLPTETATTHLPGVIASMNEAAARTTGDVVCLLDDDAEPLPDWISRIEGRFAGDPRLGALGGRDLLRDHPEMRAAEPLVKNVGIFTWYGRFYGNHHRGGGPYRRVRTFKGCNAAVRGDLLRRIGFESRLKGTGAQVHWEVALCLDVEAAGYEVAFDHEIRVIHHIAPRHGQDQSHRGKFSPEGLHDMVWNDHFIARTRLSAIDSLRHLCWALAIGSLDAPGLIQYLRLMLRGDVTRGERLRITRRAIWEARRHEDGRG